MDTVHAVVERTPRDRSEGREQYHTFVYIMHLQYYYFKANMSKVRSWDRCSVLLGTHEMLKQVVL